MFRGERRANAEPSHRFPVASNMAVGIDCRPMAPVPLPGLSAPKRPCKTRLTNEAVMTGTQASAGGVDFAAFAPKHFGWRLDGKVATITLDRPERKNPLTFASYAELRDTFRALLYARQVKAVVVAGAGGNFSSGGDVHEIIGPLTGMKMPQLLDFTRMTGDLVKAMRACPQPIVAALEGVCAGAGAILAMASDIRIAAPGTKTA